MIFGYIILGLIFCHILYVHFVVRPTWQADDFDDDFEAFQQTLWSDSNTSDIKAGKKKQYIQEPDQDTTYEVISSTPKKLLR